ncbi:hemolysin family protein [Thermaerobacillus caldiproteolyticus]|uniref:CBS domain containing-hemolysin-like protein n=1 Tax=Thermaerobacillus caldiproteolyticus TaxID=247480 RepID=A0A7V9Z6A3_9BACL|nr:hemolysin family protein [Anoxybacillus caldiproteolyticus]MBA2874771.1 CBS domain containing-hemolysin-like protein [Anoxybacillus caldiproteolyticus]
MGELPLSLFGLFLLFIVLSAFFSSAESAFSYVNKIRLKHYAEENRRGSKRALYITENLDRVLLTVLVANYLVNIAAISLSAKVAIDAFGENVGLFISTIVMTVLLLIFGEILPKSMAKERAESLSLRYSGIIYALVKVLSPITSLFAMIKEKWTKWLTHGIVVPAVTEEEIKVMIDLSEEEGIIDNKEKELVHRSLDFDEILVGEIFTPRADMIAVEVNQPIEQIRDIFLEEKYSRIPVYEEDIDHVIGILSESDFFSQLIQQKEVNVRELLRKPLFVVESMKISDLLPELQKSKVHMAIVVDEFGGTAGLITLEDIIEQIVGEIWDEHDEAVKNIHQIDDYSYELNAELPLDEFCELMKIDEPESSSHTLGGWVFEMFERIPNVGETLHYGPLTLTVRQVENRRIRKVLVSLSEPIAENI